VGRENGLLEGFFVSFGYNSWEINTPLMGYGVLGQMNLNEKLPCF
jgi:hypothetical protein